MPAIAVTRSQDNQPAVIPLTSIRFVRASDKGSAVVVLNDLAEIVCKEDFSKIRDLMTSVQVWGTISTESVN